MRLSRTRQFLGACLIVQALALSASISAYAQQAAKDAPPKLEKLEEGEAPAVTIRPAPGKSTVTEKRAPGGKRTEVKVSTGKSTYYLKPNQPAGSAQPGDGESQATRPAQWEIMTFDLNRKQKEQQAEAEQAAAPPPTLPPATKSSPAKK